MPFQKDGKSYTSAKEILTNKELDRKKSVFSLIYAPVVGGIMGFSAAMATNWRFRRPIFSGIQAHFAYAIVGGSLAYFLDRKAADIAAERDAILRHYIELHPEDFPPIQRKKYRDVLEAWVPIR